MKRAWKFLKTWAWCMGIVALAGTMIFVFGYGILLVLEGLSQYVGLPGAALAGVFLLVTLWMAAVLEV